MGPPGDWSEADDKIFVRELWSSPMVFRRASAQHVLCDDAKVFNSEARRRVQKYRDAYGVVSDGDRILILGEDDAAGEKLPSTNSQPSFVLWLLHLLDLQPGQRVLEIGSGSGWLAAIMERLVGESGHVTGIEVIPDLAAQSRADLAGLGIGNVAVLATDGIEGHAAGAP